jgi:hypothetical protein
MYDAANNTVYRYSGQLNTAPKSGETEKDQTPGSSAQHEVPSVAKIEEEITKAKQHVDISGANPDNVGGRPAYTVRVSPHESGSLIGGAELSFDSEQGLPLRLALYSSSSSAPVIELATEQVSYGAVESSVFNVTPPADAKVVEVKAPTKGGPAGTKAGSEQGKLTLHGKGASTIAVVSQSGKDAAKDPLAGLPQVSLGAHKASELRTQLGTVLSFESSGVRYLVGGFLTPSVVEAFARGL